MDYRRWIPNDLIIPKIETKNLKKGYVTIVMSTYLRVEVLRIAIESVRNQTFENWRLIIIGDATYADSKNAIDSINDERIEFVNLPKNSGDQSVPNSIGARLCTTEYLAFMSQDDLWYPNHLNRAVHSLNQTNCDFFISSYLRVDSVKDTGDTLVLNNRYLTGKENYSPARDYEYVASTWVLRTELARRTGDWKSARDVRFASSQDYLFRCWASGAQILLSPSQPSVLVIPSIAIKHSYFDDSPDIHKNLLRRISLGIELAKFTATFVCNSLHPSKIRALQSWPKNMNSLFLFRWWWAKTFIFLLYHVTVPIIVRIGIAPWEYAALLSGVKRGSYKKHLDTLRGLQPHSDSSHKNDGIDSDSS